jgi:hypothetical protein
MRNLIFIVCAFVFVAAVLVGCERESAKTAAPTQTTAAELLPADLFATTQPAGAVDVVAAKKSAKDGDAVVIKGRIGGQKEPLAANRAVMTIADISLPTCDKTPMDTCKTPWDSCCEPAEELVAKPIKAGLAGNNGLAPNKHVVVAGTAKTAGGGGDALIVQAKQIFVVP